jgi:hypothetical protein
MRRAVPTHLDHGPRSLIATKDISEFFAPQYTPIANNKLIAIDLVQQQAASS